MQRMFVSMPHPLLKMDLPSSCEEMEQSLKPEDTDFEESNIKGCVATVRSRRRISELLCCPVCSCTLRSGELHAHLNLELDRLAKITSPSPKKRNNTPSTSFIGNNDADEIVTIGCTGSEIYERVKKNREKRLRACRTRNENIICPVCNRRLSSASAEAHVDACLRKSSRTDEDDESIDIEGDGTLISNNRGNDSFGDTYEWCSEVRVRASELQLLHGGGLPHGAMRIRRASTDTHLVVDGDDDDLIYGPPQYSPSRIAPQDDALSECFISERGSVESNNNGLQYESESVTDNNYNESKINLIDGISNQDKCHNIVLEALKSRIRELEQQLMIRKQRNELKCLICIGPYNEPVVSVQCWHVYCEICWLSALSTKKTCPQCNVITTSQHLRRIYL